MVIIERDGNIFFVNDSINIKNFTGLVVFKYAYNHDEVKTFFKNSIIHRYYGPALIFLNSYEYHWIFNGKNYGVFEYNTPDNYNQKKFLEDIKNSWLL